MLVCYSNESSDKYVSVLVASDLFYNSIINLIKDKIHA